MYLHLDEHLKQHFTASSDKTLFEQIMSLSGKRYRAQKSRVTERIMIGNVAYFIKKHRGVGYREIIKNIFQGRFPVTGAREEWQALTRLQQIGINVPRVLGFGERGMNPARKESFVIMAEVANSISLEELAEKMKTASMDFAFKMKLIQTVAGIARLMHKNGIHHRDFYICHFLIDERLTNPKDLTLIDLHRAKVGLKIAGRAQIKDLAALYFSSKAGILSYRDQLRFIRYYRNLTVREILREEKDFWLKVKHRGEQLYRKHVLENI